MKSRCALHAGYIRERDCGGMRRNDPIRLSLAFRGLCLAFRIGSRRRQKPHARVCLYQVSIFIYIYNRKNVGDVPILSCSTNNPRIPHAAQVTRNFHIIFFFSNLFPVRSPSQTWSSALIMSFVERMCALRIYCCGNKYIYTVYRRSL